MRITLLSLFFFTLSFGVYAQGLFDSEEESTENVLEYTGYLRASVAGGASNYDISSAYGEFVIKNRLSKENTFLFADLRFRDSYLFNEHVIAFTPKELYAGYTSDFADIYLGNQIVSWGRTDGFNPTNKITPNDYFFISTEPDDQKMSNFMLRGKFRFVPSVELDLIAAPYYKPSVYQYNLFLNEPNVRFGEMLMPDKKIENGTYAARLNFELPAAGFSVSYQQGFSSFYGFDIESISWNTDGSFTIENRAKTFEQKTIGADFAIPAGPVMLRAEVAYNLTENYKDSIYIPNPDLAYVAGLESNIVGFTTIFQYIGKYTTDFSEQIEPILTNPADPLAQMAYAEDMVRYEAEKFNRKAFDQQKETNHAIVLTLSRDFLYSTFNLELSGYYNFTSESYLLRPMISWKIDDMLTAKAGASQMWGPENSLFDYSSQVLNHFIFSLQANF